ncbi:MAG: GTPase [Lachnospiraceae bacterium]|nr:GTPase [Lachnospiraceae bacterium]
MNNDMPVYLFTGFLDSGKTKFIQETLGDKRFNKGESTLLLLCEEGEEEYDLTLDSMKNVHIERLENESDLTEKVLDYLAKKYRAERVLVEFNGMWQTSSLYQNMPETWAVYQEFMFADATTFLAYNQNMRQLCVDKIQGCELVVFNRFEKRMDKMEFHKIVRTLSRRADIAYEYSDGFVEYDDIEDPLPFDINAPVVKVEDGDYALWYRDISEEPKKYNGKTVEYKAIAMQNKRFPAGLFLFGRRVMTCCVEDIQFAGFLAECKPSEMPTHKGWYTVRAKVSYKFHRLYRRKGPLLTVLSMTPAEAPEQEVATFY